MQALSLDAIRIDGGTQSRVEMNNAAIEDYAAKMADGADLPSVVVYFDGASYWLADGFHRYWAAQKNEAESIAADVREGTQWDAVLYAVGSNSAHGLPRTNDDKRKAVLTLLDSGKCDRWSDNQIAKQCAVSAPFVAKTRGEWTALNGLEVDTERVGADGKTYDTANIGKRKKPQVESAAEETPMPSDTKPTQSENNNERRPGPPSNGWQFVRIAQMKLEQIQKDDEERKEALEYLAEWIKGQLNE